jgi:hypothetical protein
MTRIPVEPSSRISHDQEAKVIRTWFNLDFRPDAKDGDTPQTIARGALSDSADLFAWQRELNDLVERGVNNAPNGYSVRFSQLWHNLPVDESDIVVNFDTAGRLNSIYNDYHYDIPESLASESGKLDERAALRVVQALFEKDSRYEVRSAAFEDRLRAHVFSHPQR